MARAAWAGILACAAACSGASRAVGTEPTPVTVQPQAAAVDRWTVARVLATVPGGLVTLVEIIDVAKLRDTALVGADWPKVMDHVTWVGSEPYVELCPGIADTTTATIVGTMDQGGDWTVWVLNTPAKDLRECWEDQARADPDDYATWDAGGGMLGMTTSGRRPHHTVAMIVDAMTTLVRVQRVPPKTAEMRALMEPADPAIASTELDWAIGLHAPLMMYVHGAPQTLVGVLGVAPVDSAVAIDASDGLAVHARTRLADEAAAARLLDGAIAKIPALQKDRVLGTADATRDAEVVSIEATMDRAAVVRIVAAIEARLP